MALVFMLGASAFMPDASLPVVVAAGATVTSSSSFLSSVFADVGRLAQVLSLQCYYSSPQKTSSKKLQQIL